MTMRAEDFIKQAGEAIVDRAKYRDTESGTRSMQRAIEDFANETGHKLCMSEGWRFMLKLKLARAQQGAFHPDDYVDAIGYLALEAEAAAIEAGITDTEESAE